MLSILKIAGMVMVPSTTKGHSIMGNNDKAMLPKTTATEPAKAITSITSVDLAKTVEPAKTAITPVKADETGKANSEGIKTASNAIETSSATANPGGESSKSVETASADKKKESPEGDARTKMDIATEIYKRMKKTKGVTRKEIVDQFVVEAKLSKAGASTYYQLIRAKVK